MALGETQLGAIGVGGGRSWVTLAGSGRGAWWGGDLGGVGRRVSGR